MLFTISFAPHLYMERFLNFETLPPKLSRDVPGLMDRVREIQGGRGDLERLSRQLTNIDGRLAELENQKTTHLHIRNLAMKGASEMLSA